MTILMLEKKICFKFLWKKNPQEKKIMFKSKNRGYATESESEEEPKISNEIKQIKKPLKKSTKKQRALKEESSKQDKFQFDIFPNFAFGEKQISKSEDFTNFRFTTEPITDPIDKKPIIEPKITEQFDKEEPTITKSFITELNKTAIMEPFMEPNKTIGIAVEPFVFSKEPFGKIELINNPMPIEFDFIGKQNDTLKQNHQELLTMQKQFAATQKDFAISQNEFLILQKAFYKLQEDFKIELVNLQTKDQEIQIQIQKDFAISQNEFLILQKAFGKLQEDFKTELMNLQTKDQEMQIQNIETKICEVTEAELANLQATILKIQTDHEIEMQKQSSYHTTFRNNIKNITLIAGGFICYSLFLFSELQRSNFF